MMLNEPLTAPVSEPSVAVSVYPVPTLSTLQPAKEMTPLVSVWLQPESDPGPPDDGAFTWSETVELSPVTMLPSVSSTATLGWVAKAVSPVEVLGLAMNTSFAAEPVAVAIAEPDRSSKPATAAARATRATSPRLFRAKPNDAATPLRTRHLR